MPKEGNFLFQTDGGSSTDGNIESYKTSLEGTSRIIWSNLSQQKHGLENMAQHPMQLNAKSTQHLGIHHFPGEGEDFPGVISPRTNFTAYPCLCHVTPRRKGVSTSMKLCQKEGSVKTVLEHVAFAV